ncbi:family 78 glycoside hydrolase catalytic domain [Paenibacillus sp. 5J-6]|uniref:Family 78 glycoside hydrolase catalytic domain n=1 Tax=Paenibacillus silvestris TaxID=2606219 RepID=A0A6L8V7Q4_9BACL|nr:family 78 glycoside hydrolase catalytic domain [Paenibacillus silvestris]MZQ86285.1 family 78 glycoside hydrolase catalytic domain [Paenibacillus silvestris]
MANNEQWQAQWIWSGGEESPRNEWRCFRKQFQLHGEHILGEVRVKITADSRYVLYVNGARIGRGPVRSWPFELAYDEYEIGHLLHAESNNTIAVMVMHYGVPTFQYLRGRGGLLAQVEQTLGTELNVILATDSTWSTAIHAGYDTRSSRISCQLPFTEVMDARNWDDSWTNSSLESAGWELSTVIGPAGMLPWTQLVERDIPPLTEERVYPVRIESLSRVKPRSWGVALDLRNHFVPDSENHANNVRFCGYLSTVIRTKNPVRATIGIVDNGRLFGPCSLNGVWYGEEAFYGSNPERYLDVELDQGDNFFMMDVQGTTHGHAFHLAIDSDDWFEVASPLEHRPDTTGTRSTFATIGPFDHIEIIDHKPEHPINQSHPDYLRAKSITRADQLSEFEAWVNEVDHRYVSSDDVFSACVWKKHSVQLPIPYALQNAVIANQTAAAVPIYPGEHTELIIDFGKEYSGYIEFETEAAANTIIDFYGFEYRRDGWIQHTYGLDNTVRYVCREGRQTYSSPIRRGFRYLMVVIRNADAPVKLHSVSVLQSNYAVAEIGRFQCSDPLLGQIWEISKHTTRLCMEDTFVDCPAFEQAFWVGDARNEALVNYYVFGDDAIVKRCLRLVPGSQFQSPLYADQVPSGWNSVIPNWTFFWAIACLELYRFTGDKQFAEQIWPHVHNTLDHYLERLDAKGLLNMKGWNLLDWAPIDQPRDGVVTHQNMFFVQALRSAAQLTEGFDVKIAERYTSCADRLKEAINACLWSEDRQAYVDCIHSDGEVSKIFSMQTQTVAYLCDIADGERLSRLKAYIAVPPSDFVQIGSAFMSFFYYEALAKLGRFDIMLEDMRLQYGQMIDNDATTCWEMYPKPPEERPHPNVLTRSHCHAWSAGPGYFLGAFVLGVRGLNEGWSKVMIEPQIADLTWARGTVPLPRSGRVDVSWRADRQNNKLHIRIEAPKDLELSIVPPPGYEAVVELIELG